MKILDKYFLKRFIFTFIGTIFLLVIVLILSELTTRMQSILQSKAPAIHFYKYLIYRIPRFISFTVPISIMFSVTYTISQFSRTNELMVIIASGWSYYRAIRAILVAGILITLVLFIFNETVVGDAENISQREWKAVRGQKTIDQKDILDLHLKLENTYYYFSVYKPHKKKFKDLHLIRFHDDLTPEFEIRAARAMWDNLESKWIFYKGEIRKFNDDLEVSQLKKFEKGDFGITDKPELFEKEIRHDDAADLKYLASIIPARKKAGLSVTRFKILWHERFAIPFVGIVVLFIGAIVGRKLKKSTVAISLGITILVVLLYFIIQSLGKSFAIDHLIPVWLGVWMASILYIFLVVSLIIRMEIWRKR
jgi:lipopolysaccharide export system permease protein